MTEDYLERRGCPVLRKAQHRGESMLEYIVMGAIALAVLGVAIWSVVQSASAEGSNVASWISGIGVPASP